MTRTMMAALTVALTMAAVTASEAQPLLTGAVQSSALAWQGTDVGVQHAGERRLPPVAWRQDDPADSLYRRAREAMTRDEYATAAALFRQIRTRHPKSTYAPDAFYWEAYMLFRQGGESRLREARALLEQQRKQFPKAATRGDASALAVRVDGALGTQYGDEKAQQTVGAAASAQTSGCPREDDDDRTAALNALLQMDADRAMPLLKKVLARRDACSATLRRRAVFLVSQKRTPETEQLLLDAVRNDPDAEVREQAVFWLSQVPGERATEVLSELLRTSKDEGVRDKAIFALSQQQNPRATQLLRQYAEQDAAPAQLRERAIFWLGQQGSAANATFLRGLYGTLKDEDLKERTLFSLSQMRGQGNEAWLLEVATNPREPVEMRKRALFWAGQAGGVTVPQLAALYDRSTDAAMKEQTIFVLSQRKDSQAVDKLMDIARREQNRELRQRAIFWLSQSRDPRVTSFLAEIIEK